MLPRRIPLELEELYADVVRNEVLKGKPLLKRVDAYKLIVENYRKYILDKQKIKVKKLK